MIAALVFFAALTMAVAAMILFTEVTLRVFARSASRRAVFRLDRMRPSDLTKSAAVNMTGKNSKRSGGDAPSRMRFCTDSSAEFFQFMHDELTGTLQRWRACRSR